MQEKGTVRHPEWHCITPKVTKEVDITIYYRKTTPFRVIPLTYHQLASNQVLPICIILNEDDSLILIGVYNSPSTHEAICFLQEHVTPDKLIILCGDFNLHSPEWDSTVDRTDKRTAIFQD